jgi:hypothetical protein
MKTNPGPLSEFYGGFTGTCGECALEVGKAAVLGIHDTSADMIAITHEMQAHGEADARGASTVKGLADEARRQGLKVLIEWDYAEPFPHDWHTTLLQNAGIHPIILELANGQALHDAETGSADEVGLHYHYVVVLNKQADGYVANDGDNSQVTSGKYEVYNYGTLLNAKVCGLIMLDGTPISTEGLGPGFAQYVTAHHITAKDISSGEQHEGGWSWAAFDNGLVLFWSEATGVRDNMAGEVAVRLIQKPPQIVKEPVVPPSVHEALTTLSQLLSPFAAAATEVAQAVKDLSA